MRQQFLQNVVSSFIGRSHEIETLTDWLTRPDAPWILYMHDAFEEPEKKGGVGKTWLLLRWAELMKLELRDRVAVVVIDFFNLVDRDRLSIAQRIATGLQELYPDWEPTAFRTALEQGEDREGGADASDTSNEPEAHVRDNLATALASDIQRLETYTLQSAESPQLRKTLLIVFDTFEVVEENPDIAVLRQVQTFPDSYGIPNVRVVIAGRNALNWKHTNWLGREDEVQDFSLAPFSQEETLQYIGNELSFDLPAQPEYVLALERLYARTEGRPILLGLAIDVLNARILTLEQLVDVPDQHFEAYLVSLVNQLDLPLNWVILFMAHIYHRFNLPILKWALQHTTFNELSTEIDEQDLLRLLPRLSFVRQPSSSAGNDFVLHDEMRRLVVKYCWTLLDPEREIRKEISKSVIEYMEEEIASASNEQIAQSYTIDVIYHRIFVDAQEGLFYFTQRFTNALRLGKYAYARLLVEEVHTLIPFLASAQRYDLALIDARLLHVEENYQGALDVLTSLKRDADQQWLDAQKGFLLREQGKCYLKLTRYTEAIACFEEGLLIETSKGSDMQSAYLLNYLGSTYRELGQFDTALHYYEHCMELFKKTGSQADYANVLNNISGIYIDLGQREEALNKCKIALRVRMNLFQAKKSSALSVGDSYKTLGTIYLEEGKIAEAEKHFINAFDIYIHINYKGGIASIYNYLGDVQIARGDYAKAIENFTKAQAIAVHYNPDAYVKSLNDMGYVYTLQGLWNDAIQLFRLAADVAKQSNNMYKYVDVVNHLAKCYSHIGQEKEAQLFWLQAYTIAVSKKYKDLMGVIKKAQGEMAYEAGNLSDAFKYFAEYCHHMALYSSIEYTYSLGLLTDMLLTVPFEQVIPILNAIRTYWTDQGLAEKYPEFIKRCNEVEDIMFV